MLALSTLAVLGLSRLAVAHMIMREPTPFGASKLAGDNGPLKPDGSDFPCKVGYDAEGASNSMPLGSMQQLAFTGGATHGGGSCQVSITYDEAPNSKSTFKVIHSIMGGCPARNTAGNIGESSTFLDPDTYAFKIPDNLPPGNAVLAWTWFNKVGNREMYMNCAPVKLVGPANTSLKASNSTRVEKVAAAYDSLPDMFVANIGNGCTTKDNTDLQFTDPGENVEVIASNALAGPVGSCAKASSTPVKISPDSKPAPESDKPDSKPDAKSTPESDKPDSKSAPESDKPDAKSDKPDAKSAPESDDKPDAKSAPESDTPDPKSGSRSDPKPGAFFSTSESSQAKAHPEPATSPASTSADDDDDEQSIASSASPKKSGSRAPKKASSASTPPKAAPSRVSSSTNATSAGSACKTEGEWNCIDEQSYQQCASGTWSVVMPLAAGTMCEKGVSDAIKVNAIKSPNIRFSTSHLRRHAGGSRNF